MNEDSFNITDLQIWFREGFFVYPVCTGRKGQGQRQKVYKSRTKSYST